MDVFATIIAVLAGLGALGLGSVLGWTLYFANRGKSGNLSTSDLGAIAGVVAGGAVAALIGDIGPDAEIKALVFGCYGTGLALGFFGYFLLLRRAVAEGQPDIGLDVALRSIESMSRGGSDPLAGRFRTLEAADRTRDGVLDDIRDSIAAVREVIRALAHASDAETDPNRKREIDALIQELNRLLQQLESARATQLLGSQAVRDFLAVVEREGTKLEAEADRMKRVTQAIAAVDGLLGSVNRLIGSVRRLAGGA